jgi:hypothetical protein
MRAQGSKQEKGLQSLWGGSRNRRLRIRLFRSLGRPVTFWLPGIFLLLLGFGNTYVGVMKVDQFDEMIEELTSADQYKREVSSSPLMRMQMARRLSDKGYDRYATYEERRRFYKTVAFGGKVVMALSILMFTAACLCFTWSRGRRG